MPLLRTHIVPHPPLIVPVVGRGREKEIQSTINAYTRVAESVANDRPDLIIFITPHGKTYEDYLHISPEKTAEGSFARFGAPDEKYAIDYDERFIQHLTILAEKMNIPAGTLGGRGGSELDHGVMVPLYFINAGYKDYKTVRISISGLPLEMHYRLGQCIRETLNGIDCRAVIIASGDLSHKLTEDGPYGYATEGPVFDKEICDAMRSGDFLRFLQFEPVFCEKAAECGLRSFVIMAGALDGCEVRSDFYSYEGPFGVGYAVCSFEPTGNNEERQFLNRYHQLKTQQINERRAREDAYVRLARLTLEHYVQTDRLLPCPDDLPPEMTNNRAGTFVSIKKNGALRGCIGTTEPYRDNIAEEIIGNALSAGTRDPRFEAVTEDELPELVYSVDVLSPAEAIESPEALDVKRYGVIVSNGHKRGLLLPNLDGVDTVEQQIGIALQKAGIAATEPYSLSRFEVVRHV